VLPLDLPLIAVPTLASLASQVKEKGIVIPMMDARRMEVYTAVFNEDGGKLKQLLPKSWTKILMPHTLKRER
jgi:tRNA threonylcarbamoyladenosine biosynthesis protein TsaB